MEDFDGCELVEADDLDDLPIEREKCGVPLGR